MYDRYLFNTVYMCPVIQLHSTLCGLMDCSPSGSTVHGILQAIILERVAISSSGGSSPPRDRCCISCIFCIGRRFFTTELPRKLFNIRRLY